ncbi:TIGR02281 family clan AA aspartic protease [Sphingomonas sp. BN140010]|uniref:TIGR02281 family clan AA aspartic protease n=1 Tax=Sphingomonas arvum TaxID=2992113 RepID=A0ABT3JEZ1_9SPHN|nr:TIGR02281 family clan AA aspartic protease [Sphingomonas sp. BN140010]MCW3797643.1 TIGR02281 family clan AA aspartic protease [Sphingomonas sp. BN140010]
MLRSALVLIAVATTIGVLMPSSQSPAPLPPSTAPDLTISQQPSTPGSRQLSGSGIMSLARQGDGHFYADADVNGGNVRFVIDTGASVIALTRQDAERAGLTINDDEFEVVGEGASGPVMGMMVVLREVTLGSRTARDIPAMVLADGNQSLLGQNFLAGFDNVSIERDQMVLR